MGVQLVSSPISYRLAIDRTDLFYDLRDDRSGWTYRYVGYQDEQLTHLFGIFLFYIDGAGNLTRAMIPLEPCLS